MEIDHLRSFIAIVDTGSFTRAAQHVHRTQSAISVQMKRLEAQLGATLFEKNGRHLQLTDDGRMLVSYARRLLSLHAEAVRVFERDPAQSPLRLGCPDDYVRSVLPDIIRLLQQLMPNLSVRVCCESSVRLRQHMAEGRLDLALLTRLPQSEEGYLLQQDQGVWVSNGDHEWLQAPVLPLALYESDCKFHSSAIDGLEKSERAYHILCQSSSAHALQGVVRAGLAVAALARSSVESDLTIVSCDQLPALPALDIVLAVAPKPHPLCASDQVGQLCERFRQTRAF